MGDLTDSLIKKLNHSQHNAILSHIIKLILFFLLFSSLPTLLRLLLCQLIFCLLRSTTLRIFLLFTSVSSRNYYEIVVIVPDDVTKNKLIFGKLL